MLELVEVAAVIPGEEKVAAAVIVERKRVGVVVPVAERDRGHAGRGAGWIRGGRDGHRNSRGNRRLGRNREGVRGACCGGNRDGGRGAAGHRRNSGASGNVAPIIRNPCSHVTSQEERGAGSDGRSAVRSTIRS